VTPIGADSIEVRDTPVGDRHPRLSHDLPLFTAEMEIARVREEGTLIQHVFASQRAARTVGALALGAIAIALAHGDAATILWVVATVGVYLRLVWFMGRVLRSPRTSVATQRGATRALLVGDGIAVATIAFLGGPEAIESIPIIGVVLVSVAAFYFGRRDGSMTAAAVFALYTGAAVLTRLTVDPLRPTWTVTAANAVVFALVSTAVVALFGRFRQRMDLLRTFSTVGALGESVAALAVDAPAVSDDLTALAVSFDTMRTRLAEQIGSDPLTGCANRRTLDRRLLADWRLARRQNTAVALAAIDIDHFKQINDTRGHPVGDLVLQQLASIMLSTARDTDTVARLGGDEFVIVLPDSDPAGALAFAERLRETVAAYAFGAPGAPVPVTISVGVAIAAGVAPVEPEQLMADADRLLYQAKQDGRNRVRGR
jgi:diguanylate cyclase (GGDEF)-like protein